MSIQNHFIKSYKKKIIIKEGVFIGPGSIILPGVIIGKNSFIRAGSVISKSVPDNSLVEGNPQKIILELNKNNSSLINQTNKRNLIN
jgi:maltose O-acetyltransferase